MPNQEPEKTPKMTVLRRVMAVLLVMALLLAALCVAAPTARKKKDIAAVGSVLEQRLALVPPLLYHYSAGVLSAAARNPSEATAYRELSGAMSALRAADELDAAMLIVRSGEQYVCAADGLLNSGYNTYGAGSLMSLPKAVTKKLDAIYADPAKGGIVPDLVDGRMGGNAAAVLLPVLDTGGAVVAVLDVQSSVGDTQYHKLGSVNLYALFGIFFAVAIILIVLLVLTGKKKEGTEPGGPPAPDAPENGGMSWESDTVTADPAAAEPEEKKKPWRWNFGKKAAEDAQEPPAPAAPAQSEPFGADAAPSPDPAGESEPENGEEKL